MPRMGGFEARRELKRLDPTSKVVIFTVSNSDDDRKLAGEMRCDGYFLKLFTPEDLVQEVERHLGKTMNL